MHQTLIHGNTSHPKSKPSISSIRIYLSNHLNESLLQNIFSHGRRRQHAPGKRIDHRCAQFVETRMRLPIPPASIDNEGLIYFWYLSSHSLHRLDAETTKKVAKFHEN